MKFIPLLLALSLAANAALVWLLGRAAPEPAVAVSSASASATTAAATPSGRGRAEAAKMAAVAKTGNLTPVALRDRLTALGFPEDVIRSVVRAVIEEPRLARARELYAAEARQAWWRGPVNSTPEQARELRGLSRAEREEILRVLGPLGCVYDEHLERYSFLPAEKAARLAVLQRDYAEMRRDLADSAAAGNADARERQKLLAAEYERDLAALLSPGERAQFDDRESTAARNLGYRFEYFNATEAEYRAVFALQKAYDEKFSGAAGTSDEAMRPRIEANRRLNDDIAAALGPDRLAAYLQSQRSEYRALVDLQKRYDLPQTTFEQVARLQAEISAENVRIANDAALNDAQKRAALIALAGKATTGVRAALSPALADTFIAGTRTSWIDILARGVSYYTPVIGGSGTRSFAEPPPPAAPAAPPRS